MSGRRDPGVPEPELDTREQAAAADAAELYARYGRELWALFYAQCSDPDRAHDALQETFLRWHQHQARPAGEVEPIHDARAWLLQVGRNWLRDRARREKVAARSSAQLDHFAGASDEPAFALLNEETRRSVRDGLSRLRSDDREVLVLRYALGWSSLRIAEVLGSNAAAIDMRLSRARRRLGDILSELGIGNDE